MNRFAHNIELKGRVIRGIGALALGVVGFLLWSNHPILAVIFWISATFVLFEALKGWCALRACGIKTKF